MMLAGNDLVYEPGFEVEAVDTTAAGDVFRAAFIYALLDGDAAARDAALCERRGRSQLHARRGDGQRAGAGRKSKTLLSGAASALPSAPGPSHPAA